MTKEDTGKPDVESKEEETKETPEPIKTEEGEKEEKSSSKKEEIDYDKIKQEEEERAKLAFKERQALREADKPDEKGDEPDEDDDDKPLTRRELNAILAKNNMTTEKVVMESRALDIARASTSSEAEAQAVLTFYKTRIVPTGNVEEDIQSAMGILNHKKLIATNGELARALRSKDNVSRTSASAHRDAPEGDQPKLSPNDASAIKAAGYAWDGVKRVYKKQLGGKKSGKFLYYDVKTKRTWVE